MLDHPLVIETGETFLTDAQVLRYIREKCGDAMAWYITTRIDTDELPVGGTDFSRRLKEAIERILNDIDSMEESTRECIRMIEEEKGVRR